MTGGNSSTGTVTLTAIAPGSDNGCNHQQQPAATTVSAQRHSSGWLAVEEFQHQHHTSAGNDKCRNQLASLNGTSRSATLTHQSRSGRRSTLFRITRAEYDSRSTADCALRRRARVQQRPCRCLSLPVTNRSARFRIDGGGRYRSEFNWPVNPQSMLPCAAISAVKPRAR